MNKKEYCNLMKSWLHKVIECAKREGRLRITSTHIIIEHNNSTSAGHPVKQDDDIVRPI